MSRALLQQALDALENHAGNYKLTRKEGVVHNAAIVALQAALAQPEPEPKPVKPLTDEQIVSIRKECYGGRFGKQPSTQWGDSLRFARAIEAAHGIRPKGVFIDMIATHEGLAEELAAMDAPEVRRARPDDTEGGEL